MNTLLTPHYEATQRRVAQEPLVLVLQDTTFLNYQTHTDTEGLGPIGTSPEGVLGLILHDSLAVTPAGVPLGVVDIQYHVRDKETFGKGHQRKSLPIEEKESYRWIASFEATTRLKRQCPKTTVVSIADREADCYDLFLKATSTPQAPKLLIRSFQKRALLDEDCSYLEKLQKEPSAGIQSVAVPRQKNRKARVAQLSVRFREVTLKPPRNRGQDKPVTLWAVSAQEEEPPLEGGDPIRWVLLTTMPVHTFQDACQRIEWYCMRWLIEIYHRTLKSGCKIEERQLGAVDRIENCLAIDLVVAWRIFFLTKQGQETPDVPCTACFIEAEWKALVAYVTQNPIPPPLPPTLKEAIFMVAGLGGFLGRKGDGYPGTKTMWLGLERLDDLTGMWLVMINKIDPQQTTSHVSRKGRYR